MGKLLFLGVSGHLESVMDSLLACNQQQEFLLCEPLSSVPTSFHGLEVLPGYDPLQKAREEGIRQAFVGCGCIGGYGRRKAYYDLALETGFQLINIVDPSAVVSPLASLGRGIFIGKNAVVNAYASLGDQVIVNTASIIEHNCHLAPFVNIAPNCTLCGSVQAKTCAYLGAGSTVRQCITLGEECFVGMGSLLLQDVPDRRTFYGHPAKDHGPYLPV